MQVPKIKDYLKRYYGWMLTQPALELRAYWETQTNWQQHFDLDSSELAEAYERALSSQTNRRHYSRRAFEPKAVMLALLHHEADLARATFDDLLREGHTLDGRLRRFAVYMDELFRRYQESKADQPWGDHFHGHDHQLPSLYLAMQYPDRYLPYDTDTLFAVCQRLGARDQPQGADPERLMKIGKLLDRFLRQDQAIMQRYEEAFLRPQDYQGDTLLLSWHLMQFIAQ